MRVEKSIDGCVVTDAKGRVLARGQVEAVAVKKAQERLARESKPNTNPVPNQHQSAPQFSSKKRKSRRKKKTEDSA